MAGSRLISPAEKDLNYHQLILLWKTKKMGEILKVQLSEKASLTNKRSLLSFSVATSPTVNPLSPNIDKQILQTDPYTFPYRISWKELIKDQRFFSL